MYKKEHLKVIVWILTPFKAVFSSLGSSMILALMSQGCF